MDYFERLQEHSGAGRQKGEPRLAEAGRPRRRVVRDIIKPGESAEPPAHTATGEPGMPLVPPLPPEEIIPPAADGARSPEASPPRRREPEAPTVELDEFVPAEPTIRAWEPRAERRARLVRRAIVAGVALLAAAGFSVPTFVFPTFVVTVIPKVQTVALTPRDFTADIEATAVDIGARRLPALLITREQAAGREYESSGKKFVKERARGTVTIANAYSSSPQVLVANTRLQDSAGRIFRLVKAVSVPGATVADGKTVPAAVDAEVVADEAGDRYNIGPSEFRIPGFRGSPKYDGFTAKSAAAMNGGHEGEARIVTTEDIKRASEDLTASVVAALGAELDEKVPAGDDFLVPAGARQVTVTAVEAPRADEARDRFTVRVAATGRLFALRRSHLAEALGATVLPETPPGTAAVIPATQPALTVANARASATGKQITFSVSGSISYYFRSDPAEVESIFRGMSPDDAVQKLLARPEVESARIKRFPRWLWFVPARPGGFSVDVEEAVATAGEG